jgi:Cu2+-exporting ATPase
MVRAGALNIDEPIHVAMTVAGADMVMADIARPMEQAGQGRSRYVGW